MMAAAVTAMATAILAVEAGDSNGGDGEATVSVAAMVKAIGIVRVVVAAMVKAMVVTATAMMAVAVIWGG
jgi:hypothetical protein